MDGSLSHALALRLIATNCFNCAHLENGLLADVFFWGTCGCVVVVLIGLRCVSTQHHQPPIFAVAEMGVFERGRTHLTSIVAPMAEEWERSNYACEEGQKWPSWLWCR